MSRVSQPLPVLLVVGPAGHGVVQYGADVASSVTGRRDGVRIAQVPDVADAEAVMTGSDRVHVHVTDRILGQSPEQAADVVERWASGCRISVTLHDVPQPSDGTMFGRRCAAYGRMAAAASATAVNSRHEQELWLAHIGVDVPAAIPLGARVERAPGAPRDATTPDLAVLIAGFVYPGKGHLPAIRAAAAAAAELRRRENEPRRIVVRAIGAPSRGHEDDIAVLSEEAARLGVTFEVTGFLDERDFSDALRAPGVPLAAHEHVSASRSMLDWVEVGRRPLVVDSRYAREMDELRPGTMRRYRPDVLAGALVDAWLRPGDTWLSSDTPLTPTIDEVADRYLTWWAAT
jgi:hypothetical protein